jgi:phosphate-selective porin
MRRWLATLALVLAASASASARILPTRMDPWRGTVSFSETHEAQLQAQIDAFTRAGAFPAAGRSLETKVREASAFLDREFAKPEQRGVGASAAIVYKDKVSGEEGCSTLLLQSNAALAGGAEPGVRAPQRR